MRGKTLHNYMVQQICALLFYLDWQYQLEFMIRRNGITNFLDIYGMYNSFAMAFEIETTDRHIIENCYKAVAVDIPVCIIVPTSRLYRIAHQQIESLNITPGGYQIKVFKLSQLEKELKDCLSLFIAANSDMDKQIKK